ncbi:asparagine--tRNA ligase [Pycnococcus provasolii]
MSSVASSMRHKVVSMPLSMSRRCALHHHTSPNRCSPSNSRRNLVATSSSSTSAAPSVTTSSATPPTNPVPAYAPPLTIASVKADASENVQKTFTLQGWVRTVRAQKAMSFVELNDGSCLSGLQILCSSTTTDNYTLLENNDIATGAAVRVTGTLQESPAKGQAVELAATSLELVGVVVDPATYPLSKKRHTLEYLRTQAHLRPRTNVIGAVARIRSELSYATHTFFRGHGFWHVHTPIITASDCEGAGEQFVVTTLLGEGAEQESAEELEAAISEQGSAVRAAKDAKSDDVQAQVAKLLELKEKLAAASAGPADPNDVENDFFARRTSLTVSGQLNAEAFACALGKVYTFGPTFRAENSNTSRHLAEFWMVEPELAYADLQTDLSCAASYLRHCCQHVLDNCAEDVAFLDKNVFQRNDENEGTTLVERLQSVATQGFKAITYTEAVNLLLESGAKFEFPVEWGVDLQSEHERYLCEKVFNGPVAVTDYPKDIKAFYMRLNDDGKTVAAVDLLVPGVGELIGGSQREERLDVLERRMREMNLEPEDLWWYVDLRKYGSVPHAGFGLGFERLVQYCTGMENIRDVIPFPRYPGHADF